jgi:alpha-L-rhamnosidase
MRGIEQTAFRVLVATSNANLDRDNGDAWDSGKTATALVPSVSYAGKALNLRYGLLLEGPGVGQAGQGVWLECQCEIPYGFATAF